MCTCLSLVPNVSLEKHHHRVVKKTSGNNNTREQKNTRGHRRPVPSIRV